MRVPVRRSCPIQSVMSFGVFVTVLPGVSGLCHISELDTEYVDLSNWSKGDTIDVKCLEVWACLPAE